MGGREHSLFKYGLLVCLSLCLILPAIALGQEEEEEELEFMLEDIVVTAEKREAELQKIPMDIDVVRPEEMRLYNINQMVDLQKMIPDMSITNIVGTFNLISIREVQTMLFNPIYETTVATHLDGIQLGRFAGLDNFFFDLERVEILKGPQGTLYGRGSTAGSMNIITRRPILGEFSGNASIEAGNYSRYRADWAANFPMGDTMAMRIAGRRNISAGYSDSGFGDANSWSHRLSWRWEPNDRTTINLSGDYISQNDNGFPMAGFNATGYYYDTYGDVEIVAQTSEPVVDPRFQSGGPVYSRGEAAWALGNSTDVNYVDSEHYGITASGAYEFDFATLTIEYGHRTLHEAKTYTWAGAYLDRHPFITMQMPWGPWSMYIGPEPATQVAVRVRPVSIFMYNKASGNTNTAEVRLTSNTTIAGGDKLEWIAGVMGQKDMTREIMNSTGAFWFDVQIKTETEGAFLQASWMPVEKWNFTGGIRHNADAKDYYGNYMDPDYDYFTVHDKWSELTYRANISYFPTDDIMPYLTYSRGYRTGNIEYGGRSVPPEFLNAWELGLKSRFFENKLQFNAGYYYYDYENYSDWVFITKCWEDDDGDHFCDDVTGNPEQGFPPYDPDTGIRTPDGTVDDWDNEYFTYIGYSPGGAEQKGVAVNIDYLPTMDDRVSLTASWRNNKYASPYDRLKAILELYPDADSPHRDFAEQHDLGGYEFGGAPIRGNVSYTHTFRFVSGDTLFASGTAFYEGEGIDIYVNQGFPNEYVMPGREDYWTADVSFMYNSSRWMPAGNMWGLRFSVQNIFDNDALSSRNFTDDAGFTRDAYPLGSGVISGNFINPRTYSLTFDINF